MQGSDLIDIDVLNLKMLVYAALFHLNYKCSLVWIYSHLNVHQLIAERPALDKQTIEHCVQDSVMMTRMVEIQSILWL